MSAGTSRLTAMMPAWSAAVRLCGRAGDDLRCGGMDFRVGHVCADPAFCRDDPELLNGERRAYVKERFRQYRQPAGTHAFDWSTTVFFHAVWRVRTPLVRQANQSALVCPTTYATHEHATCPHRASPRPLDATWPRRRFEEPGVIREIPMLRRTPRTLGRRFDLRTVARRSRRPPQARLQHFAAIVCADPVQP